MKHPFKRENKFKELFFVGYFYGFYIGKSPFLKGTIFGKDNLASHLIALAASRRPGFANLPARMAEQASAMYAQNMANLLRHVHGKGGLKIQSGKGSFNQAHLQKGWMSAKVFKTHVWS